MSRSTARTRPPKGGLVFTGSLTIRLWKTLAQNFPQHHVINRGFGGWEMVDATHSSPSSTQNAARAYLLAAS